MTRSAQLGAGLVDCLLGLVVGLMVLQAMAAALAATRASVRWQQHELGRLEGQRLAQQLARALADAARAAPPGSLRAVAGRHGDVLRADMPFATPCADNPRDAAHGARDAYWLVGLDARGTLQCSAGSAVAQPLVDAVGDWRIEFVEQTVAASAPDRVRLRLRSPSEVRDWRRVRLLQLRLQGSAPGGATTSPPALRLQFALRASAPV